VLALPALWCLLKDWGGAVTKVYGASDDLIEFEGELSGEVGCFGTGDEDDALGVLVALSDGTILAVRYGKPGLGGVWGITMLRQGEMFERLDICTDEDANPYSDVAHFKAGKLKAWAGRGAEAVR
jgi:hypothetical protein